MVWRLNGTPASVRKITVQDADVPVPDRVHCVALKTPRPLLQKLGGQWGLSSPALHEQVVESNDLVQVDHHRGGDLRNRLLGRPGRVEGEGYCGHADLLVVSPCWQ
jgi:hypothetical protein